MPEENIMQKGKDKKILICDDDKAVCDFLERFLKREGYEQTTVSLSGEEALEKIQQEDYHLVLLDISLPGINGIETLKRIKEINNNITVIMITGLADARIVEESMKNGAYDYITKPFDLTYLKLALLTKFFMDIK